MTSSEIFSLCYKQIEKYHETDSVDAEMRNPYPTSSFEALMWEKSWVDTVQWHLEDLIRPDDVDPVEALKLKRRIDRSNQRRTDLVECIDDHYMALFHNVQPEQDAAINTETPAWAIDRLSILALKIYHFSIEANRGGDEHRRKCQTKLDTLLTQRTDLTAAIDQLLADLAAGKRIMKLYRQMKMYNDPSLNPMLYKEQAK